jgi:hypothetical protein
MNQQIKSKERVTEHGEVYTSEREVNNMLDLVNKRLNIPKKSIGRLFPIT